MASQCWLDWQTERDFVAEFKELHLPNETFRVKLHELSFNYSFLMTLTKISTYERDSSSRLKIISCGETFYFEFSKNIIKILNSKAMR